MGWPFVRPDRDSVLIWLLAASFLVSLCIHAQIPNFYAVSVQSGFGWLRSTVKHPKFESVGLVKDISVLGFAVDVEGALSGFDTLLD